MEQGLRLNMEAEFRELLLVIDIVNDLVSTEQ